jgi:hypothetical protein
VTIPGFRCDCGSEDLFSVAPGTEGEACDLFAIRRPVPARAWCVECWGKKFGAVASAAEERA